MSFLGLAWCLMLAEGLIVNGIESLWSGGSAYRHLDAGTPTVYVPPWAETFFSVHITGPQFTFFLHSSVLPGVFVMVRYSVAGAIAGVVAAGLGAVTAYVLLMLLSSPAAILDDADHPMVRLPLSKAIRVLCGSIPPLVATIKWLHRVISAVLAVLGLRYMLEPSTRDDAPPTMYPSHFIAITSTAGLMLLIAASPSCSRRLIPFARAPSPGRSAPALVSARPPHRWFPAALPAVMYLYISWRSSWC